MRTFHSFKDTYRFQKFLTSGKYPKCHEGGCLDHVKIDGLIYTMHEYDMGGQSVTWANRKNWAMIEMTTGNRYKNGYGDAKVIMYQADYMRNDITYAQ